VSDNADSENDANAEQNPDHANSASEEAGKLPAPEHRLSTIEARVIGALMEKQLATPDAYPLTVNSLLTACASSNHAPLYATRWVLAANVTSSASPINYR